MSIDLDKVTEVYADGGVIWDGSPGASTIGGTWAFCFVDSEGNRIFELAGVLQSTPTGHVTNNWTEQVAIVKALENLPEGWSGLVCSDSQVALGRVFKGWREKNLPRNISDRSKAAVSRLGTIETKLLQGHPTKADLECGIGKKRGYPVSIHNIWCDEACGIAGKEYVAKMKEQKHV